MVLTPKFNLPVQSQTIKIGSSPSNANIVLSHDKFIDDLQIGIQIKKSQFAPDENELYIMDLSLNNPTKVTVKGGNKFTLHDEAVISFGGIVRYSIKYNEPKTLMTCTLNPHFDDADLKKN